MFPVSDPLNRSGEKRRLLARLLLWTWLTITGGLWPAERSAAEQMNVVLIVADDLGWKDLGCQGNPALRTPRLNHLAGEGVRFTSAYAAAPVCSPTRAALVTGLAPARLSITQHGADGPQFWPENRLVQPPLTRRSLPDDATTIAERLRAAGYATGFFGKWHLGDEPQYWPTAYGFDANLGGCGLGGPPTYFDPYRIATLPPRESGEYLTDRLADEAIAFLRRERDRPMLLCLWTYNPHYPFEAPEELISRYRGREGPGLKNAVYGAQIEATDRAIGRVLDAVDALGLRESTLVAFTSDNGGWTGATDNWPLRGGKGFLYEGGLRVPLIVRWPGVAPAGGTLDEPVVTMDVAATVLDAAEVPRANNEIFDGRSLRPLLQGRAIDRNSVYFHYPHFAFHKANRPGSAVRSGDYKLILRYDDESVELYNLADDLSEKRDLASQQQVRVRQLEQELREWLTEVGARLPQSR